MKEERTSNHQVITFGCRLNSYESEAIKSALATAESSAVSSRGSTAGPSQNLIILNSCAVTNEAERKLRQAIRRERKKNPDSKIIVTGCAAQINPEKYASMAEVDVVLGNQKKSDATVYQEFLSEEFLTPSLRSPQSGLRQSSLHADKIFLAAQKPATLNFDQQQKILVDDIMALKETAPHLVTAFESQTRAFLEVQNGCNHRCTFCVIPFGRGNSRSVPLGRIVDQIKQLVASGHQEIVLSGVDISDYGKDLPVSLSLAQMMKRILKLVPELPRLRLSSIDVAEVDDELFELIAHEKRIMPYLHISVQSGDDLILKRMKRRHTRSQVIDFSERLRATRADVSFGADFIAGFPTETDEMFLNSVALIAEADIAFNHIFPYSRKEGTPAAKMPQVTKDIISKRAKILREAGNKQLASFLDRQVGKTAKVLVERDGIGRCENFAEVRLSSGKAGEIVETSITKREGKYLVSTQPPL